MREVYIYTDGSSLNAKKYELGYDWWGGSGAVLLYKGHELRLSEPLHNGTNQQSEIYAVTMSLRALKRVSKVMVVTDSKYVIKGVTEWSYGWVRKGWVTTAGTPVKNKELWQDLLAECAKHDVLFKWVKGHSGDKYNDLADELAVAASTTIKEEALSGNI
jgi:ribonuclease HI